MLSGVRAEAQWGSAPGEETFSPRSTASHIELLLRDVSRAVEHGSFTEALRLADRARRLTPRDISCIVLCARLLILLGSASEAIELLNDREDPEAIVTRGEAFCSLGLWDDASACCDSALRKFAVDSVQSFGRFASQVCLGDGGPRYPGWIGVDSRLRLIGEIRNDGPLDIQLLNRAFEPESLSQSEFGFSSFVCSLPSGISGHIMARSGGAALLGSGLAWPPNFDLAAWAAVEDGALVGEARLGWFPAHSVTLAIGVRGEHTPRQSVVTPTPGAGRSIFSIPLQERELEASQIDVSAVLPDGSELPLVGSPVEVRQKARETAGPLPKRLAAENRNPGTATQRGIDIVIPVYAGCDETLSCIQSVLASLEAAGSEVVVVDDASPDANLSDAMIDLAKNGRITLLTNTENQGFPAAANTGLRLHSDRDVVLLNSDTEVFGDWLVRLRDAAYSAADIGTVTPLCENGSITQYSRDAGSIGIRAKAAEIDRIACAENAGKTVEIPVGVGFCLYLKRDCLNETGELDEAAFSRGYGEESDFCLRARKLGWRHVAATGLFVSHRGGMSYGARMKELLLNRSRSVLNSLHPGYGTLVKEFLLSDPLLESRRAIDMAFLRNEAVLPILLVTLDLPGGVKRHVDEREAQLKAAGHTVLVLRPAEDDDKKGTVRLAVESLGLKNLSFDLPGESRLLRDLLLSLGLSEVEIHHFLGHHPSALELATTLGVPYDVYIHDYLWICPRVTLIGGTGEYCGEPPVGQCETCIRLHGSALEESLTVEGLRRRSSQILAGAHSVVVPCQDTRERLVRYFPGLQVKVVPWESRVEPAHFPDSAQRGRVRVAVIGAIGIQKGFQVLLQCARDAAQRELDLEFVVIGYSIDDEALLATGKVFITGPYEEGEIDRLLEREQCHVAFFPSVWPETWCYSLTHALSWGLAVLAFDHGALAERLRTYSASELVPLSTKADQLNESLLELSRRSAHSAVPKEVVMDQSSSTTEFPPTGELTSSVQIVTLPAGIYSFTVQGGAEQSVPHQEVVLPALQVSLAPARSAGSVEFLTGGSALDRWLVFNTDMMVVRIDGGDASLLLTSVRMPDSPVLGVNVNRLNAEPSSTTAGSIEAQPENGVLAPAPRVRLHAHVKNVGDLEFQDCWAGWPGQGLWIEAFSITVAGLDAIGSIPSSAAVEYCAVTAEGFETPWLTDGELCGSRGTGMPILGFGVRLAPEASEKYDCVYRGKFLSGTTLGPLKDGVLCCSDIPGDPLEGIEVRVTARQMVDAPIAVAAHFDTLEA
jgi:GT2 family glycosyltransferase/glycosyltransferase involved in cell wall biosynthesis